MALFTIEQLKKAFNKVINHSTLIFARDEKSYEYATGVADRPDKILKAPDITLFYSGISCNDQRIYSIQENYVCIIPNIRMLDQGKNRWGDKYELYLIKAIQEILSQKYQSLSCCCMILQAKDLRDSLVGFMISFLNANVALMQEI